MNFRKELENEQKILENLLETYAPNLWEHIDEDAILICDNIDDVKEEIVMNIEVASLHQEPMEYLKENDPNLKRAFSIANGIWNLDTLDASFLALLVFQDDLTSEMNNLLPRIEEKLF